MSLYVFGISGSPAITGLAGPYGGRFVMYGGRFVIYGGRFVILRWKIYAIGGRFVMYGGIFVIFFHFLLTSL